MERRNLMILRHSEKEFPRTVGQFPINRDLIIIITQKKKEKVSRAAQQETSSITTWWKKNHLELFSRQSSGPKGRKLQDGRGILQLPWKLIAAGARRSAGK